MGNLGICKVCGIVVVESDTYACRAFADGEAKYTHLECERRQRGMKRCPTCKGKGEVEV